MCCDGLVAGPRCHWPGDYWNWLQSRETSSYQTRWEIISNNLVSFCIIISPAVPFLNSLITVHFTLAAILWSPGPIENRNRKSDWDLLELCVGHQIFQGEFSVINNHLGLEEIPRKDQQNMSHGDADIVCGMEVKWFDWVNRSLFWCDPDWCQGEAMLNTSEKLPC